MLWSIFTCTLTQCSNPTTQTCNFTIICVFLITHMYTYTWACMLHALKICPSEFPSTQTSSLFPVNEKTNKHRGALPLSSKHGIPSDISHPHVCLCKEEHLFGSPSCISIVVVLLLLSACSRESYVLVPPSKVYVFQCSCGLDLLLAPMFPRCERWTVGVNRLQLVLYKTRFMMHYVWT